MKTMLQRLGLRGARPSMRLPRPAAPAPLSAQENYERLKRAALVQERRLHDLR